MIRTGDYHNEMNGQNFQKLVLREHFGKKCNRYEQCVIPFL